MSAREILASCQCPGVCFAGAIADLPSDRAQGFLRDRASFPAGSSSSPSPPSSTPSRRTRPQSSPAASTTTRPPVIVLAPAASRTSLTLSLCPSHAPPDAYLCRMDPHERSRPRVHRVQHPQQDVSRPSRTRRARPLTSACPSLYDMTLLSYLIAFGHFGSEVLIYRSAKLTGPVISPVIVACECPSPSVPSARAHPRATQPPRSCGCSVSTSTTSRSDHSIAYPPSSVHARVLAAHTRRNPCACSHVSPACLFASSHSSSHPSRHRSACNTSPVDPAHPVLVHPRSA